MFIINISRNTESFVHFSRVAEPENLKTVPVPTFYLNTIPVPGHIHAYTHIPYIYVYIFVYVFVNVYIYIQYTKHILIQYIHSYSTYGTYTCTHTYTHLYKHLYSYLYMHVHVHIWIRIRICVRIRETEMIKLLINFFEFLLHFLVPGTGTVFRIRFRCRSPQMITVPTGSGSSSGSATLHFSSTLVIAVPRGWIRIRIEILGWIPIHCGYGSGLKSLVLGS